MNTEDGMFGSKAWENGNGIVTEAAFKDFTKSELIVGDLDGCEKNGSNVDHPNHYQGAHECIDVMVEMFGPKAVADFCKCNIFKYRFRAGMKNGEEDIKKAEWYEEKLMELNRMHGLLN